jgi:hypothetical protein
MKEEGCAGISIGIESGSDKILNLMRKKTTIEKTKRFMSLANKAGLSCVGSYMVGNEGENEEDLKASINMVIDEEMNSDASLTSAYQGTLIYKNALKRGLIKDEWDFLEKFKFGPSVWDFTWKQRNYLNISEIPNEQFWNVLVRELRRYYTFLFNRYQAKSMRFKFLLGSMCVEASGFCPTCGEKIKVHPPFVLLEMETYCPKCFYRVYFNIYQTKALKDHFELLCGELKKAERLVISGTGAEAAALSRIDRFGLEYDHIKGFLETKPQGAWDPVFINMQRIKLDGLLKIQPDLILVADDEIGDTELLIRLFYLENKLRPPRILHLFAGEKQRSLKFTRFAVLGVNFLKFIFVIKKSILRIEYLMRRVPQMGARRTFKKIINKFKDLIGNVKQ